MDESTKVPRRKHGGLRNPVACRHICGCCYELAKAMRLADPAHQSVRWR